MIALKILGAFDLIASSAFLMLVFGIQPFTQFLMFCAGLLIIKGFFAIVGNVLSMLDILFAIFLIISIFFALPTFLLWIPAFILIAKGLVSFI